MLLCVHMFDYVTFPDIKLSEKKNWSKYLHLKRTQGQIIFAQWVGKNALKKFKSAKWLKKRIVPCQDAVADWKSFIASVKSDTHAKLVGLQPILIDFEKSEQ